MQNLSVDYEIGLIALIITAFSIIGLIIVRIFLAPSTRPAMLQYDGVVAPFFGLPAVLFSLTAALMATSIWENYNVASKAIKNESQGLMEIISLTNTIPELKNTSLADAARVYAKSIIDEEWQTLSTDSKPSLKTQEKFVAMRTDLFKAVNQLNNNAESKALMSAFQMVNNAREMRLAFVSFDVHPIRWYAILLLAVLVQIAVGFIHVSKPKALIVALSIATATVLVPICMIALTFSSPYLGVIAISSAPYLQIQ